VNQMRVSCPIEVGMILKSNNFIHQKTVCEKVIVSAVGKQSILALDTEGTEHRFWFGDISSNFTMIGWNNAIAGRNPIEENRPTK